MAQRLYLTHLRTGDTISAQFNPTEMNESLGSDWKGMDIQGATDEPLQWRKTGNHKVTLELGFHARSLRGIRLGGTLPGDWRGGEDMVKLARHFLLAIHYPTRFDAETDITLAAPSPCLIVWPGWLALKVKVRQTDITHREWDETGPPIVLTARLTMEADNDKKLFYEDVLRHGTNRGAAA
jgi:hypothetical protein